MRILLVEDDPDIRAMAAFALESLAGHTVKACESGEAAVAAAPEFRADLVLLDVLMPGMDGRETFYALRALPGLERLPVAFLTARAEPAEIAEYKAMGAIDVIPKPFPPPDLCARVAAIAARLAAPP